MTKEEKMYIHRCLQFKTPNSFYWTSEKEKKFV